MSLPWMAKCYRTAVSNNISVVPSRMPGQGGARTVWMSVGRMVADLFAMNRWRRPDGWWIRR